MTADGSTTSTITVTLLDAGSNPVSGKTVALAKSGGSSTISAASGSSNASGVVTFTVKDTVAETTTYTATDTTDSVTITQTATVTFTAGPVNAGKSTVSAIPTSVVADGTSTSTITVTLRDANNNPVSGKTVTLSQGGGSSTISAASGPSNASGVVTFTVKDTTVESVTYTATDTNDSVTVTQTATVTFTVGPVNAGTSTVSANPTSVTADGTTTSTITVTLKDASNRAVSGKTVTLAQGTGTSTISAASGPSNGSGVVTFTVKDTKGETVTYTATDTTDSVTITQTATVTFNNPAPTTTSISPTTKTVGDATFTLTVNGTNFVSTSTVNFNGSGTDHDVRQCDPGDRLDSSDRSGHGRLIQHHGDECGAGRRNFQCADVRPSIRSWPSLRLRLRIVTGTCSSPVTVQTQNANGSAAPQTPGITLNLSSNSGTGKFFSDASLRTAPVTSVPISAGASTASFFYKDTTSGGPTITVASAGLTSVQQAEVIATLRFSSAAFSVPTSQCSTAIVIQSVNPNPTALTQSTTINLSSSSAGGKFYSDAGCTTQITTTTIAPGIDGGHDTNNFFYKDTQAGTPTLSAAAGTALATQTESVVAPPSISKAFGVSAIPVNGTTSLTFTITNPAANTVAQTGVAFTDTLPAGLVVATPNGLTSTCGGTTTAVAGSGSVSLTGGTVAVNSSCTISVNVKGTTSGTKNNTTGTVSSTNGGTGNTASASVTVATPPTISKAFGAASIPLNASTSLSFTINNPNTIEP